MTRIDLTRLTPGRVSRLDLIGSELVVALLLALIPPPPVIVPRFA
jgi:hypothetical protein